MFQLADRFGEIDPRKVSALPADILIHWQAYLKLLNTPPPDSQAHIPTNAPKSAAANAPESDFDACLRVIGNG
ncbi:hypothetical protein B4907_16820 [Yersinia kristensenii]|nr:hypothetical protein B4907_16820 [Yersinia kristensenii]